MASGCNICDPEPRASARGNIPAIAARAVDYDWTQSPSARMEHGVARQTPLAAILLICIEQQDAILRHNADHHDYAHER